MNPQIVIVLSSGSIECFEPASRCFLWFFRDGERAVLEGTSTLIAKDGYLEINNTRIGDVLIKPSDCSIWIPATITETFTQPPQADDAALRQYVVNEMFGGEV